MLLAAAASMYVGTPEKACVWGGAHEKCYKAGESEIWWGGRMRLLFCSISQCSVGAVQAINTLISVVSHSSAATARAKRSGVFFRSRAIRCRST